MPDTFTPSTETAAPQLGGGTRIPAEIAIAIGAVMAQVKSLPKGERNDHGGYAFASIDAFLAAIGPLCSAAGLIVVQDEESMETIDRGGKAWLRITYSFLLAHTSGVMWDRPTKRTVYQRIDGPQTTGGTQSYAMKMYLRSLFQIPTGDQDDPDFHAKEAMQAAQKPQERVERSNRADPPKAAERTQRTPSDSGEPVLMQIETGRDGLLIGRWVATAKNVLHGKPEAWRREWLELHGVELEEVRKLKPDYADKLESIAVAPDPS